MSNIAIGNEGLERFELELHLHANTWARWKNCLGREADLKAVIGQKNVLIDEKEAQRSAWEHDALRYREKATRRGVGQGTLTLLAAVLGYIAFTK